MRDDQAAFALAEYQPPIWLPGGHTQTIYPSLRAPSPVQFRRERVETSDGDFWDFDWTTSDAADDAPLLVLFHGLEGNSGSHYASSLMQHASALQLRGVVPHFRGCSGEPNRMPRQYHSGDHEEVAAMLAAIRARVPAATRIFAVGVSLGGSALLNWLGRAGASANGVVTAAAAVSAPLDLMAAGVAIGLGANRIYTLSFLRTLKPKALALAQRFPGLIDGRRVRAADSMQAFDDAVTAPLHGFANVEDYWTRGSSKPWLAGVAVPTLVLNAQNDPFIPAGSLPGPAEVSEAVVLEQPQYGGHAGFLTGPLPGRFDWVPRRLAAHFLYER